jgi:hypothetical protein
VFYVPRPARSILLSYFLVSPNFLILPSYFATLTVQGKTGVRLRVGTTFTVISNTAATPIARTFANLPDGSIITIRGNNLQASYEGGDGNDLTLTVVP